MAITIINSPSTTTFAKNPIGFAMSSNNVIETNQVLFRLRIHLNGPTTSGNALTGTLIEDDYLELKWLGKTIRLTAKNAPNTLGNEIPSGSGNVAHANNIVTYLAYNKVLASDFTFSASTVSGDVVVDITAKKVPFYTTVNNSLSDAIDTTITEAPAIHRSNFKFWWSLNIKIGNAFSQLFERLEDYSNDFLVKIDIQKHVRSSLDYDRPTLLESNVNVCTKSKKTFFVAYAEYYGIPASIKDISWTNEFHSYLGGLSRTHFPNNQFFTTYLNNTKFLTWWPNDRIVRKTQPLYLSYIITNPTVESVKLRYQVEFTDGTSSALLYSASVVTARYDKVYLPAGYTQLNIASVNTLKTVKSWSVALVNGATNSIISEIRKYIIDTEEYEFGKYFLFHSSLGNYETIFTYGKQENELEFTIESAEIQLEFDYQNNESEYIDVEASMNEVFSISSGYIFSEEEYIQLKDFIISTDKLYYDRTRKMLIPIRVDSKSIRLGKDGQGFWAIKFEYSYRYNESNFTPSSINLDPSLGSIGAIPNNNNSDL